MKLNKGLDLALLKDIREAKIQLFFFVRFKPQKVCVALFQGLSRLLSPSMAKAKGEGEWKPGNETTRVCAQDDEAFF